MTTNEDPPTNDYHLHHRSSNVPNNHHDHDNEHTTDSSQPVTRAEMRAAFRDFRRFLSDLLDDDRRPPGGSPPRP